MQGQLEVQGATTGALQAPLPHTFPEEVQFEQLAPWTPQAASVSPGTQLASEQHPLQVAELHCGAGGPSGIKQPLPAWQQRSRIQTRARILMDAFKTGSQTRSWRRTVDR